MVVDLKDNFINPALPLKCGVAFTGSALPIILFGVPASYAGRAVAGMRVKATNADGIELTADCTRNVCEWYALLAATNFTNYGFISKGFKIEVRLGPVADGGSYDYVTIGCGDLEVLATSASATPGTPATHYVEKGGDLYLKTQLVEGVQHYTKQTMVHDPEIGWGAEWSGDYILDSSGNFVEVTE